jgi:tRNA A37 methylthiotransferase MiaB
MSYRRYHEPKYLIARRKGNHPLQVVSGRRFRLKKRAEEYADQLNKAYEGSDVKFIVREVGWRRKRGYS